ncbi:acetyl-CoA carboxylase carboxyltransferase subunit alpha [PVC group bacterium (ex Bugula neritina AB1)]|nr:acetyl-CoA carboxylase carboxyltransferase subunit alpha [PVC group bacterium (ex Bugula neritina AB1)]
MGNEERLNFEAPIVELEKKIEDLKSFAESEKIDCEEELSMLYLKLEAVAKNVYASLTPWQKVQIARHPQRPYSRDYIDYLFEDFVEMRGDKKFSDDPALVCGFGKIDGKTFAIVGHQKGRDIKEKMACHFGCAHPEGYRKAWRLMKLAEKMKVPIITFIDTPGAYPGISAEERGQSEAIAANIMGMTTLRTPSMAIIIGEGGSGGALGIGLTDIVAIMENSYYSVISPEGCAAILWRDKDKASEAASALKIMSKDLLDMGIVDDIIQEPRGGAHRNFKKAAENIKASIFKYTHICENVAIETLLDRRYKKYRQMGQFHESPMLKDVN